jgi:hypothetical protein
MKRTMNDADRTVPQTVAGNATRQVPNPAAQAVARMPTIASMLSAPDAINLPFSGPAAFGPPPALAARDEAPRAPAPLPPAGADHVFADAALVQRAAQVVEAGPAKWRDEVDSLAGEARNRFIIASIPAIAKRPSPMPRAFGALMNKFAHDVGVERLLAQKWPGNANALSWFTECGWNAVLVAALKTNGGKALLRPSGSLADTALHIAARCGNLRAVEIILEHEDDEGSLCMRPGKNALLPAHHAAGAGSDAALALLLRRKGREQRLALVEPQGCLPLHLALQNSGDGATVALLLADCAEEQVLHQLRATRNIPLMSAVYYRLADCVKPLLAVNAVLPQQLTMRNAEGKNALEIARESGDAEITALIEEAMRTLPAASLSEASRSATTSTSATTTTSSAPPQGDDAPVPMTPFPQTPMAEAGDIDDDFLSKAFY